MAKKGPREQIILEGEGGHRYYTFKNKRNTTDKLVLRKYNPKTRKHEEYKEGKNKFK